MENVILITLNILTIIMLRDIYAIYYIILCILYYIIYETVLLFEYKH